MSENVVKVSEIAGAIFAGLTKHGRSLVLPSDAAGVDAGKHSAVVSLLSSGAIVGDRVILSKAEDVRVSDLQKASRYLVRCGDVIVVCRGTQIRSAVVTENPVNVAITASLIAIRITNGLFLPTLLSAYLNHPATIQSLLRRSNSRTNNVNISATQIGDLPISVPPMEIQKALSDLYSGARDHKESANRVADEYLKQASHAVTRYLSAL